MAADPRSRATLNRRGQATQCLFSDVAAAPPAPEPARLNCLHLGVRTVPITVAPLQLLRELRVGPGVPQRDALVIGAVKGHILRSRCRDKLIAACVHLGFHPFTWHGVRRHVVVRYRRAGVTVKAAAALLGHCDVVMLREYDKIEAGDLEAEVGRAGLYRRAALNKR